MDKEELFKEYTVAYRDYLYGECSFDDIYSIIEKIEATIKNEAKSAEDIEGIVRANETRISKIQEEVRAEYDKITEPIVEELLDFLQFQGLVKSTQYEERAEELKKKLQKYDRSFRIRERALMQFFLTKIGSRYDDYKKMKLLLRLGALDIRNL